MFLKSFRVKSNAAIRGSDRRKLRNDILRAFPYVTQELASEIIPNKEDMSVMKITTHFGQHVTAYTLNGSPIFFQVETILYPTVYLLWKYPDMLPVFTTWPNVFEKLSGGADLMLPGIIQTEDQSLDKEKEFQKDEVCSVALLGNRAPVAVGYTAVSTAQAREQGMRGKGVIILHSYLDQLWAQGSKSDIPIIPPVSHIKNPPEDTCTTQTYAVDFGTNENVTNSNINDGAIEIIAESKTDDECNETLSKNMNSIQLTEQVASELSSFLDIKETLPTPQCRSTDETEDVHHEETPVTLEEDATKPYPTDAMDKLLERSFMHALLCIKISKLPILASTFFKNYVLSCCPQDQTLDIKRSSYKKLTKFLQVMEKRGFIAIKEQSKGVHYIDSVNWANENLKTFKKENLDVICEKRQNDSESVPKDQYQPPEIEDVFAVSGSTRPLFESLGYSKGAILTAKEVRQVVTEYIKSQELDSLANKRIVKLDPALFSIVHKKGEDNYDSLTWDEVFKRIIDRMNPCHIVIFKGQAPITRKGKLELIEVKVEQRMGNKKVTLVQNLEYYGIDPADFSHKLQLMAASSTSVSQLPGKSNPGQQVLIQGNQILHVARTLQDDYQIATKYINGLDKLKQSKSKKK